jgi:signal transduction histidine kinase
MRLRFTICLLWCLTVPASDCYANDEIQTALDKFYASLFDSTVGDPTTAANKLIEIGKRDGDSGTESRGYLRLAFINARPKNEKSGWRDDFALGLKLAGTKQSVQRAEALMFGGFIKARADNKFEEACDDLRAAVAMGRELENDRVIAMVYLMSCELHLVSAELQAANMDGSLASEYALRALYFARATNFGPLKKRSLASVISAMKASRRYAAAVPYAREALEDGSSRAAQELLYLAGERPGYPEELKHCIENLRKQAPADLSVRTPLPYLQTTYATYSWDKQPEVSREFLEEAMLRFAATRNESRLKNARLLKTMTVSTLGMSSDEVVAAFHVELGATPERRFERVKSQLQTLDVAAFYEKHEQWKLAADWRARELAWLRNEQTSDVAGVQAAKAHFDQEMKRRAIQADVSTAQSAIAAERAGFEEERVEFSRKSKLLWGLAGVALAGAFLTRFVLVSRHRRKLVAEVSRQTESLEGAKREADQSRERAERADAAKSEFLACINHELRTPLNAILGSCQLLQRDNECGSREFEIINSSSEHLLQLVNNVLDVSSIEHGETTLDECKFDLHALGESVSHIVEHTADKKGIPFQCDIDPSLPQFVYGDEGKLRQILINLCSNAIKFTESGCVRLRLSSVDLDGVPFTLNAEVTDTGTGIPASQLLRMFEPFSQSDEARKNRSGTGLGLYICRTFAEGMGGSISVESRPGFGSEFRLQVPLDVCESGPVTPSIATASVGSGAKILVVDDNRINVEVITGLLAAMGYQAFGAENKQQAMALMEQHEPAAVLMDLHMPGADGFEILELMRATPSGHQAQMIALTGDAIDAVRKRAFDAGFDAFLAKPVRLKQLERALTQGVPIS